MLRQVVVLTVIYPTQKQLSIQKKLSILAKFVQMLLSDSLMHKGDGNYKLFAISFYNGPTRTTQSELFQCHTRGAKNLVVEVGKLDMV